MNILEDLTTLTQRKLEKRLEQLAKQALPCLNAWVADGNRQDGLTVALHVNAKGRPDVTDLGRVLQQEPAGLVTSAWALLPPTKNRQNWKLLLRVELEQPVHCKFVVRLDVTSQPNDPLQQALPLLLAASRLLLVTDDSPTAELPEVWFAAPPARECIRDLLSNAT